MQYICAHIYIYIYIYMHTRTYTQDIYTPRIYIYIYMHTRTQEIYTLRRSAQRTLRLISIDSSAKKPLIIGKSSFMVASFPRTGERLHMLSAMCSRTSALAAYAVCPCESVGGWHSSRTTGSTCSDCVCVCVCKWRHSRIQLRAYIYEDLVYVHMRMPAHVHELASGTWHY